MYNSSQMCVMNSRGVQKYVGSVWTARSRISLRLAGIRYLLVLDSGVDVIKLG